MCFDAILAKRNYLNTIEITHSSALAKYGLVEYEKNECPSRWKPQVRFCKIYNDNIKLYLNST